MAGKIYETGIMAPLKRLKKYKKCKINEFFIEILVDSADFLCILQTKDLCLI